MRRAPGLGPAAAPRAASRAMSLRSGLGPAVSAAVAAASSRLGCLDDAARLVRAGLFAMGVRCKSASCLGTVHCITAICHIITNHSFVVLRLIPIPLPHNRFDFLLLILARAHLSVRTVLGRYTAPRGVF